MLYKDARPGIQNGDVFAFESRSLFGKLIGLRTGSRITHVGFALWLRIGNEAAPRLCVLEAMEGAGVRLVPMSYVLKTRHKAREPIHWLKLSGAYNGDDVIGFALSEWGQAYASPIQFISSFGLLTRWIRRLLHIPARLDPHRWFCSQIVAFSLHRVGFRYHTPPVETTPADVLDFACLAPQGIIR